MKLYEKIVTGIFIFTVLLSGIIRFLQTKDYNTAFTYDQSRDLLDIRAIGEFKDFAVLGPTTSINGLRLGPFYYYLNLPAYWMGKGNPQMLVYWNILLFLFSGVFIFWYFKNKNMVLGFLISGFYLMAPQMFNLTRYFWNANMATYLSVYFFITLWNFLEKKDKKSIFWLGLSSALLTQFEAAFGIVCLLFSVLIVIINKKIKYWKEFFIGVVPWFLPQILLEIKNKFQMTKLLLGVFSGGNSILGEKIPIATIVTSHFKTIRFFFEGQFIAPYGWGLGLLIVGLIFIGLNKKYRKQGIYFISFLIFAYLFYITIYRHELKQWYLESLRVWYCFILGISLVSINKFKKIGVVLIGLLLIRNLWLTSVDQWQFVNKKQSDDPKNLANLINNINWIYSQTNNEGFSAYNYVAEIYDFPHQYLYWWYGIKKYGYMPNHVSYSLTEIPKYIRLQEEFYEKTKEDSGKIALIYETKDLYVGWLNQFKDYCLIKKFETNWRTILEIREKCD